MLSGREHRSLNKTEYNTVLSTGLDMYNYIPSAHTNSFAIPFSFLAPLLSPEEVSRKYADDVPIDFTWTQFKINYFKTTQSIPTRNYFNMAKQNLTAVQ